MTKNLQILMSSLGMLRVKRLTILLMEAVPVTKLPPMNSSTLMSSSELKV